jgi:hypothetical protein
MAHSGAVRLVAGVERSHRFSGGDDEHLVSFGEGLGDELFECDRLRNVFRLPQ